MPKVSHRKLKIAENETPNNIHHSYILLVTIHAQTRLRGKVCLLLWAGPVGLGGGSWHLVGPVLRYRYACAGMPGRVEAPKYPVVPLVMYGVHVSECRIGWSVNMCSALDMLYVSSNLFRS